MRNALSFFLGNRGDWHLRRPWLRRPQLKLHWLGPIVVTVSIGMSWFAFGGTAGLSGSSTFSMWIGATSILLMAWSFILALRVRLLEPLWGGLDSMYRGHRWAGAVAVACMFLHTQFEPRTKGADVIAGASGGVAEAAEDLAETGELMLYVLIGISVLRLIPYRWWKWTHKLLGLPFAFASWHFVTAHKPYDNFSAWGLWFIGFIAAGLIAYVARVFVRDAVAQGAEYTVVRCEQSPELTEIELRPASRPIAFEPGQFAFIRLAHGGLREPHPLSIASSPSSPNLRFAIRHLGDWSDRIGTHDLVGTKVRVEGPYGTFHPLSKEHRRMVWIAGGVGITPFLSALDSSNRNGQAPPLVLYACKSTANDPLVERLRDAQSDGLIELHLFTSSRRLAPQELDGFFPNGMRGCHVALCGPETLVATMGRAAADRGARSIETEDFNIRQGFGPDRSREIDRLVASRGLNSARIVMER